MRLAKSHFSKILIGAFLLKPFRAATFKLSQEISWRKSLSVCPSVCLFVCLKSKSKSVCLSVRLFALAARLSRRKTLLLLTHSLTVSVSQCLIRAMPCKKQYTYVRVFMYSEVFLLGIIFFMISVPGKEAADRAI